MRLGNSFCARLYAGTAAVIALVAVLVAWTAYRSIEQHHDLAASRAQNVTEALAMHVSSVFDRTDLVLRSLAGLYETEWKAQAGSAPAVRRHIEAELARRPELRAMYFADADGTLWPRTPGDPRANVSDRAHFIRVRDGAPDELVFSEQIIGRVKTEPILVLARRLSRPDGSFAGMVAAAIPAAYFSEAFAKVDLGTQGLVTLRSAGLAVVARSPAPLQGKADKGPSERLRAALAANPQSGTVVSTSTLDGIERLSSYRRLERHPFTVVVGTSMTGLQAAIHRDIAMIAALGALAIVLTLAFSAALHRAWALRERAAAQTAREKERAELLLRNASDGVHIIDADGRALEASDTFCRMLGCTRDEVLRMQVWEWDDKWSREDLRKELADQIRQPGGLVFETVHRHRKGRRFDVEVSATPVSYDGKPALFCSAREITERKSALNALQASHFSLQAATAVGQVGLFDYDTVSRQAWRSTEHARIFGYATNDSHWDAAHLLAHVLPEDRESLQQSLQSAVSGGIPIRWEGRIRRADESVRWVRAMAEPVRRTPDAPLHIVGSIIDITDRKSVEDGLRLHEAIIQNMKEGVCLGSLKDGSIMFANPQFEAMFGYARDELNGKPVAVLNAPSESSPEALAEQIQAALRRDGAWEGDVQNIRKDGSRLWCHAIVSTLDSRQTGPVWMAIHQDITDRKLAELELQRANERLQTLAVRDALTGLFNRRYLDETIARELAKAERGGFAVSVIMLDIDHFKSVNDRLGHAAGDAVLHALGTLLASNIRGGDIACRYGGEEFLLVLPHATAALALQRAEQLRAAIAAMRVPFEGADIGITVSASIATYPGDGSSPDRLICSADDALYAAKQAGRDRVAVAGNVPPATP